MTDRPTLVLLPGLICDAALWRHQLDTLTDIAEVTMPDLTRFDDVRVAARTLLSELPPSFALAGLSMGGYVAFEIMRQAPGRVSRLALLDTSARADTPEGQARRRGSIEAAAKPDFDLAAVTQHMLPMFLTEAGRENRALVEAVTAMAVRYGREAFGRSQALMLSRPDSRPDLPQIGCPTLVLCGRQDVFTTPELHLEIARGIPNSVLVYVEDAGHLSPMEQPHAVSAAMRYWLNAR